MRRGANSPPARQKRPKLSNPQPSTCCIPCAIPTETRTLSLRVRSVSVHHSSALPVERVQQKPVHAVLHIIA